ncbi:MAG: hypothetical protein WC399_03035 [Bacilli bacterium]|jgi:hypothetical protein
MNLPVVIIGLVGTIVFLIGQLAFIFIYYRKNIGIGFSLLNRFPFEAMLALHPLERRLLQIPLALFAVAVTAFFYGAFVAANLFLTYLILFVAVLAALSFVLLFYVKTTFVEKHVLVASLFMMLILLLSLLVTYYAFTTPFDGVYHILLRYAAPALAMIQLLIMINPRLKSWGVLEAQKNGAAVSYVRPRVFILPLSEWITLANLVLLMLATALAVFL